MAQADEQKISYQRFQELLESEDYGQVENEDGVDMSLIGVMLRMMPANRLGYSFCSIHPLKEVQKNEP